MLTDYAVIRDRGRHPRRMRRRRHSDRTVHQRLVQAALMTTALTTFCGCVCPKCRQQQHHNSCYCRYQPQPPVQIRQSTIDHIMEMKVEI
jgi:hypothetical protein